MTTTFRTGDQKTTDEIKGELAPPLLGTAVGGNAHKTGMSSDFGWWHD